MPKFKILIVDDEAFNVDYLEQELEELDYETFSAENGKEALEKVESESPDLILLDIMMPILDGFEVLTRLKKDPNTRNIPVIVISASNDLQSIVKGIKLGAEDYLPKPFEPVLLQARISSCLEKKRLQDIQQLYLKSLEQEFDIAREIQKGFLPTELPVVEGWNLAAYFKAAHEVAGDFYDAFVLSDGNLVCLVGDVCGKGVGAALFMTLFRSLLRATCTTNQFINGRDTNPLSVQERLQHAVSFTNNYVTETHGDANMFATVFIGIFNPLNGVVSYINCGNEPALVIYENEIIKSLIPTGPVIGVIPDAKYAVADIEMEKGQYFLAFTDGIPDALDIDNIAFGNERLHDVIHKGAFTSSELLKQIESELNQYIGSARQFDDITVMAIQKN